MLHQRVLRSLQILLLTVLAGGGLSGCGSDESPVDARPPHAMSVEWPAIELTGEFDGSGGLLEDPSGVRVRIRAETFAEKTKVVVKTDPEPAEVRADVVVRGPILELAADPPHKRFFEKPVEVTLPFAGDLREGPTPAYWTGSSWRRFGGKLDPLARTVTFDTLGFSTYTVVLDAWGDWPEVFIDDPRASDPPVREVPRGAIVELVMKLGGTPPSGMTLLGRMDPERPDTDATGREVLMAPDPGVPAAFTRTGAARLRPYIDESRWTRYLDKEGMWARFLVRVPPDAPLGRYDLELSSDLTASAYGTLGWPHTVRGAIQVTNRKTFLLIIDGLHSRIFENALRDPYGAPPNLGRIFGSPKPKGPPPAQVALRPSRAGRDAEAVAAVRLGSGYIFPRATTIFPSYTFAGNAAIVTGHSVGEFGIPGNEFFDRAPKNGRPQRRYSFTSAYATANGFLSGRAGFLDPVRSYWIEGLANGVLRTDTVYEDVASGDLQPLGLKNIVSVHMYFGAPRPDVTKRLSVDVLTQAVEFQMSSHGVDFDKDMLSKMLTALGRAPRPLSASQNYLMGITPEENVSPEALPHEFLLQWLKSMIRSEASTQRRRHEAWMRYAEGVKEDSARARAEARETGLLTFYFASLDHAGHAHYQHPDVRSVHRMMLYEHIDPMIGELLKSIDEVTLRNALFVVVSDHGQSDMGAAIGAGNDDQAAGHDVPQLYEWLNRYYNVENENHRIRTWKGGLELPTSAPREIADSDCVVAYNSGLAHVYIRHSRDARLRKQDQWAGWQESLASPQEVFRLARTELADAAKETWRDRFDLLLLRLPKDIDLEQAPSETPMKDVSQTTYFALDPGYPDAQVVPLSTYLDAADPSRCVLYEQRYGWTIADKAFLLDAIQSMNSDRTGDVVILPRYPAYYFEYSDFKGNHGGLVRDDMECTLGVAIPGLDMEQDDRLQKLVLESIDLIKKPRVGNRDVRSLVANYYRQKAHVERTPVVTGGLTVRSVRPPGFSNAVEITTDALAALGPDEGLMFVLYRTDDPERVIRGSREARDQAVRVYGDDPVVDPTDYAFVGDPQGRIARDKFQLLEKYDDLSDEPPPHFNPGPYYYQVGMTRIDREGMELGGEMRSGICGPGTPVIDVLHPPKGPQEDIADFVETDGDWALIAADLTFSDNQWACDGAEFVAETKAWKGHYYAGHEVDGTLYGDDSVVGTGMMARIWIPHPSPGGYVRLTARGKGFSAERTLRLPPIDPGTLPTAPAPADPAAKLEDLRGRVARMETAIAESRAGGEQAPWHQLEMLAKHRFDLAHFVQIAVPSAELDAKRRLAQRSLDRTGAVRVLKEIQAHAAKGLALTLQHYGELRDLYAQWIADSEEPSSQLTFKHKTMEDNLAQEAALRDRQQVHRGPALANAALLAGDVKTFREASEATVAAARRLGQPEDTVRHLRHWAEGVVRLTGDRREAQRLWQDADKEELESAAPDRKERIREQHRDRSGPAWWPADE